MVNKDFQLRRTTTGGAYDRRRHGKRPGLERM